MTEFFVSNLMLDTRNFVELEPYAPEKTMPEFLRNQALNKGGSPLAADAFYTEVRATKSKAPGLKDLCIITDQWILVSDRLRIVLETFDMGAGGFYPTRVCSKDGSKLLSKSHCFWNFGNSKKTWLPNACPRVEPTFHGPDKSEPTSWFPPVNLEDGDIAVTPQASDGPDVWAEWRLKSCLLFSGALVRALQNEHLDKPFYFKSCRILEAP